MIDPLARGVDPVQLAFQSLVSMGARTPPIASPLGVALNRLGVDLARGEPFTTTEARQLVELVRATLEVFTAAVAADQAVRPDSAVPATQPAPGTRTLLETAQLAMRDLQRALTQVLTDHRQLTTRLAPILRELLLAVQAEATLPPQPRPTVPARLLFRFATETADSTPAVSTHQPPPTLAGLVRSLVESIAHLQTVLPHDAVPRALDAAVPEHPAAAAGSAPTSGATALPAATTRLLQSLLEAVSDLLMLLPPLESALPEVRQAAPAPSSPAMQNLVRALGEAVVLVLAALPAEAVPLTEPSAPIEQSRLPRDVARGSASAPLDSAAPPARIASAVARVVVLVHELLVPESAAEATPVVRPPQEQPVPTAARGEQPPRSLPGSQAELPLVLAAGLAQVVAGLKVGLPPGVLEAAADDSTSLLTTAALLAELTTATTVVPNPSAMNPPADSLQTLDAYRWALLVGLSYGQAHRRTTRAPLDNTRPRCATCNRLLVLTPSGALVCPTC